MPKTFGELQRRYWHEANAAHYAWQTGNPVIASGEASLLDHVQLGAGERLLEIGSGEGANLHHLRAAGARLFAIDFSFAKASFNQRRTAAYTAASDAARLPFADAAFDVVLIRDLLHHVPDVSSVLGEAYRILRPGGRLTLIEPNRNSPLILLQAAMIPAERGVMRSTSVTLRRWLDEAGFTTEVPKQEQPLPLERLLLHPAFGAPSLGYLPGAARAFAWLDRCARRLLPVETWMYLVCNARRPTPSASA